MLYNIYMTEGNFYKFSKAGEKEKRSRIQKALNEFEQRMDDFHKFPEKDLAKKYFIFRENLKEFEQRFDKVETFILELEKSDPVFETKVKASDKIENLYLELEKNENEHLEKVEEIMSIRNGENLEEGHIVDESQEAFQDKARKITRSRVEWIKIRMEIVREELGLIDLDLNSDLYIDFHNLDMILEELHAGRID